MQHLELRPGALLEEVGDMWVAFSAASGETHLLNVEAAAFLEVLSEAPRNLNEVIELMASESGRPAPELLSLLEDAAATLTAVGLIRDVAAPLAGRTAAASSAAL